jgi:S-adenosylmethionine:tRNA ribosyltransferase-isomerase
MSRDAVSVAASTSVGPESPTPAPEPPALRLEDLDYELPPELIAQHPVEPRDTSRLLVYRGATRTIEDRVFRELPEVLRAGDVLVRNDTRVFAARSFFRRATGGRIEVLFLRPAAASGPDTWEALLRGRPRRTETLESERLGADWQIRCDKPLGDGRWLVTSLGRRPVLELLEEAGVTPLPPYIREPLADAERYQTSYAREAGSSAAPTAGLHFTPALDDELRAAGVQIEALTLHVGLGTFKPLAAETLRAGRLHGETYEVEAATWARLLAARAGGRRVLAVGTTSMRTLEHLARVQPPPASEGADSAALCGETSLLISPGFDVRLVDGLLTNFHLPRTSLMALVMAVCGVEETRRLYRHAVDERYRFYSFGDAMLAL